MSKTKAAEKVRTSLYLRKDTIAQIRVLKALMPGCESDARTVDWVIDQTFDLLVERLERLNSSEHLRKVDP